MCVKDRLFTFYFYILFRSVSGLCCFTKCYPLLPFLKNTLTFILLQVSILLIFILSLVSIYIKSPFFISEQQASRIFYVSFYTS